MIVTRSRPARLAPASNAIVGYTTDDLAAFSSQVHGGYVALDLDLRTKLESKWGKDTFVASGKIGDPSLSSTKAFAPAGYITTYEVAPTKAASVSAAQMSDFLTDKLFYDGWRLQYVKWLTYYANFLQDNYLPGGGVPGLGWFSADAEYAKIEAYRVELADWQKRAEAALGVKTVVVDKPKQPENKGGGGIGGFGEIGGTLNALVWLVGIGFGFYILMTVAAPLLSGAAKTKEEYKRLRA